jgi:hypothetical protein
MLLEIQVLIRRLFKGNVLDTISMGLVMLYGSRN